MSAPLTRTREMVAHGCISAGTACHAKRAYWSRNDADHEIKVRAKRGVVFRRYGCPFAHPDYPHWHLTSAPKED